MAEHEQVLQAERFLLHEHDIAIANMAAAAVRQAFSTDARVSQFHLCVPDTATGIVRARGERDEVHAFVAAFGAARGVDLGLVRAEASLPIEGFHERYALRQTAVAQKLAEIVTCYGAWQPALFPNEIYDRHAAPKLEQWSMWEVRPYPVD